jgi:hypothetical protein
VLVVEGTLIGTPNAAARQTHCSLCAAASLRPLRTLPDGRALARCASCSLVHVLPRPDRYEDDAQLSDIDDFVRALGAHRAAYAEQAAVVLARIERVVGAPGALFEVGSAAGWFLDEALARGWDARGIEPARNAQLHGSAAARARITHATLERAPPAPRSADAVVLVQVLEHLLDPLAALRVVADALTARGAVYIEVPSWGALSRRLRRPGWETLNFGVGHWHLFDARTLSLACARAGLRVRWRGSYMKGMTLSPRARRALAVANVALSPLLLGNNVAVIATRA